MNAYTVSVIIRTQNRKSLLRRALESLDSQSFQHFQVVIVEDGIANSESVVEEFPRLSITYHATGVKVGRTVAANIGLSLAEGQYINFLDDDDYFLPNHLYCLLQVFDEHPDAGAVHAAAEERLVKYECLEPLRERVYRSTPRHREPLNKQGIFQRNYFPIQAVLFKRDLYHKYGGLDESLEYLEDWDLWIKFSLHAPFRYVDRTTSAYTVVKNKTAWKKRRAVLESYGQIIRAKYEEQIRSLGVNKFGIRHRLSTKWKQQGFSTVIRDIIQRM